MSGQARIYPALKRLYQSIENFKSSVYTLVKSVNTHTKCGPSPSHGGLHKIAISLETVSKDVRSMATDLNKVIDSSGNFNGNLNPVDNDILKMASDVNVLAAEVRNTAAKQDYYSGDFEGANTGLEHLGKSFKQLASVIERLRGNSKKIFDAEVKSTQVKKGTRDVHTAISVLIRSMNRHLKQCGQTGAVIGNIPKGLAEFNNGLEAVMDAV